MAEPQHRWQGASGTWYLYYVYQLSPDLSLHEVGGNYIFAKSRSDGLFDPLYIGQTENLKKRITTSHHRWPCVKILGATHIHAHRNMPSVNRTAEEQDLIKAFRPPCND